jgi:thioesterase domain-containing protein
MSIVDEITPFVPSWVVPLQSEGSGRPVFVFPSADNEAAAIAIDARLAALTGRDRPFWAFAREDWQLDLVREHGVAAIGRAYGQQMQAMQGCGPFLLFGTCIGGYAAWIAAEQLLSAGEAVAGIFFVEVAIRPNYTEVLPGNPPVTTTRSLWRLSQYYCPPALPVRLVHVMAESWHERGWWQPWHELALGGAETIAIPQQGLTTEEFLARREATIAQQLRAWIERVDRP